MSMTQYDDWAKIELAEAMVDSVEEHRDDVPEDLMNEWDRSDMIRVLVDEHGNSTID
jgi:hypothetical protein